MTISKNASTAYTDKGGRFAPGNTGRPAGALHKVMRAVEVLLEGQGEELTCKAIEVARGVDTTVLALCIERIASTRKDAPVEFEIPCMETAEEAVKAASAVIRRHADRWLTVARN